MMGRFTSYRFLFAFSVSPVPERAISHRLRVIVAFALVYVFWGSTYLAIRVAVEHVPPILMAGIRFSISGSLLLAFCAATGRGVAVGRERLVKLALIGFLLLAVSNAILAWAELYVPTGLAALIVAVVPIWFLLVERFVLPTGYRVPVSGLAGIALGLAGMVVLLWPKLVATHDLGAWELAASLGLLASSFCWAFGSVLSRRWHLQVDPLVASAWQMTFAGLIDGTVGLLLGQQHQASWKAAGVGAVLYLVVFGSWVGYSAYIWLLRHVPTAKVATYAYVNPIVAVFLGWLVLGESVDGYILAGAAIIVPAVALVTRAEAPPRDGTQVAESG
jgi:drug/metabolite transporter (DMT)-like permease